MDKFAITGEMLEKWITESGFNVEIPDSDGISLDELESLLSQSYKQMADLINKYCVPRPTYKDGTPIQFGDTFEVGESYQEEVNGYGFYSNGICFVNGHSPAAIARAGADSWKQLEADALLDDSCAYFNGEERVACADCPANGVGDCFVAAQLDMIRRAKKLAGVKDE